MQESCTFAATAHNRLFKSGNGHFKDVTDCHGSGEHALDAREY